MTVSRVMVVLLGIMVVLQGVTLYRMQSSAANTIQPDRPSPPPPVWDAPEGTLIDVSDMPTKGRSDAKVVLLEFSDYECPFCTRHATGTAVDIEKKFVETGKIKVVFVNNPLPIHKSAKRFAAAAICAGEQSHYWEMHNLLFGSTPEAKTNVSGLAESLRLDPVKFRACADSNHETAGRVEKDMQLAARLELKATPSFALGRVVDHGGQVKVDKLLRGALPLVAFENNINKVLEVAQK